MTVYEFYCDEVLIGHLQIRDGQHCYIPMDENVKKLVNRIPLDRVMIQGQDWGRPIPFFKERIENAKRFGMEKRIFYHTDLFLMRMVESDED